MFFERFETVVRIEFIFLKTFTFQLFVFVESMIILNFFLFTKNVLEIIVLIRIESRAVKIFKKINSDITVDAVQFYKKKIYVYV